MVRWECEIIIMCGVHYNTGAVGWCMVHVMMGIITGKLNAFKEGDANNSVTEHNLDNKSVHS